MSLVSYGHLKVGNTITLRLWSMDYYFTDIVVYISLCDSMDCWFWRI